VSEVLGMESDVITLQDVFIAKPPDEDALVGAQTTRGLGPLGCTGLKPHFLEKMAAHGVVLPPNFFQQEDGSYRPSFQAASFGGFS
jgi:pilus assembly protein CpaF